MDKLTAEMMMMMILQFLFQGDLHTAQEKKLQASPLISTALKNQRKLLAPVCIRNMLHK